MRKQIFIGSSSESIKIAKQVEKYFSQDYDCTIWKNDFFTLNQSTYDNLIKKSIAFDYAIFIGGKDDFVERVAQKTTKHAPRDNIYLEFGIFAGIISPERTFFIVHKNCTLATDLDGITVCKFNSTNDVKACCHNIAQKIDEENKIFRARLLPSVSLAIGYYENFLKDACYAISKIRSIKINNEVIDISNYKKQLKILIPQNVTVDWRSLLNKYYQGGSYIDFDLEGARNFGVKLDYDALSKEKCFSVIDLPQTLRSSFKTIDFLSSKDFIGESDFLNLAKQKEVVNFVETIKAQANSDVIVNDLLIIEDI